MSTPDEPYLLPANLVLGEAMKRELVSVIIIGRKSDGTLDIAANGDAEEHLRDIQTFLMAMDAGEYDGEDDDA